MATHKDAIKRARQNIKRRARNRHYRSLMRNQVKKVRGVVASGDHASAAEALSQAMSVIHKVASKGVVHRKQAARRVSRLAKAVKALEPSA